MTCPGSGACCGAGDTCGTGANGCAIGQCCPAPSGPDGGEPGICGANAYLCPNQTGCCPDGTYCGDGMNGCSADQCCALPGSPSGADAGVMEPAPSSAQSPAEMSAGNSSAVTGSPTSSMTRGCSAVTLAHGSNGLPALLLAGLCALLTLRPRRR